MARIDENLLKSFEEQEEELREKLRKWIEAQELSRSNNIIKNKEVLNSDADISSSADVSNNDTSSSTDFESNIVKSNNNTADSVKVEITGKGTDVAPIDDEYLDFDSLVTVAVKVKNGYEIKHIDANKITNGEEKRDYLVLVKWDDIIPENPSIDDIDKIIEDSKNALTNSITQNSIAITQLQEINSSELTEKKQKEENKKIEEKSNDDSEIPSIDDVVSSEVTALKDKESNHDEVDLSLSDITEDDIGSFKDNEIDDIPSIDDIPTIGEMESINYSSKEEVKSENLEELSIDEFLNEEKTEEVESENLEELSIDELVEKEIQREEMEKNQEIDTIDLPSDFKIKDNDTFFIGDEHFDEIYLKNNQEIAQKVGLALLKMVLEKQEVIFANNKERFNMQNNNKQIENNEEILDADVIENSPLEQNIKLITK